MGTKTLKKILAFSLASIAGLGMLFVPLKNIGTHNATGPVIYAATGDTTAPKAANDSQDLADALEVILKIIYLLLWPFLALAGLCLDNGIVYGSYFQLDAALFTFWNIVKNFANFALGFLFLRSILKYIFNFGSKPVNPLNMITKLLIAGIGIQASWFLMGALIDLSTVATVAVGGLPLQLLKDTDAGKKPLFGTKVSLKISEIGNNLTTDKGFVIFYTYPPGEDYYVPCAVKDQKLLEGDKWAKAFGVPSKGDSVDTSAKIGNSDVSWSQVNQEYCMYGNNILQISSVKDKVEPGSEAMKTALKTSQDQFMSSKGCSDDASICQTVSNIAKKGQGYQGAFYALYGSLLNLGSINVSVYKSNASMSMEAIIKTLIGLAYLVPLLILCVVLIIRIAVLWIMIAFSPILVLAEALDFDLKSFKKYGIKSALSMIFLPVMATFAISISIVFLSVLSEGLTKGKSLEKIGMATSSEGNKTCISLIITKLCIDVPSQDIGISGMLDFFPWIILNIFGIGLMWTILMATMKNTEFTGKLVDSIDKFAKSAISTAPIIPLPGGGRAGIGAFKNAAKDIGRTIDQSTVTNANTVVTPSLQNFIQKNVTGQVSKGKEQISSATSNIKNTESAKKEVQQLLSPNGALYNPQGTGFGAKQGNSLDLEQYGNAGLDLVNKLATVGGIGATYKSVDQAFSDTKFLNYLNKNLGLSNDDILSLYTGREGGNGKNQAQQDVINTIRSFSPTASSGSLASNNASYTGEDGSTYTMSNNGFTKKGKDGKTTTLTKEDDWKNINISAEDLAKMKKKAKEDSPSLTFTKEFDAWLTKNTGATPTPTNNPSGTNPGNNTTTTPAGTNPSQPGAATPTGSSSTPNTTTTQTQQPQNPQVTNNTTPAGGNTTTSNNPTTSTANPTTTNTTQTGRTNTTQPGAPAGTPNTTNPTNTSATQNRTTTTPTNTPTPNPAQQPPQTNNAAPQPTNTPPPPPARPTNP